MSNQERLTRIGIQNNGNVIVTCSPRIAQQPTRRVFKLSRRIIAQKLQRCSQRLAPLLIPAWLTTSVTPTVSRPTRNTVHATPRTSFTVRSVINLNGQIGRMMIEILRIVRDPETRSLRFNPQRMRQTEIAKLEVVSVSLTISRDVYEIPEPRRSHKFFYQPAARRQSALKRN